MSDFSNRRPYIYFGKKAVLLILLPDLGFKNSQNIAEYTVIIQELTLKAPTLDNYSMFLEPSKGYLSKLDS